MKRVKTACLEQTIHFQLKEDLPRTMAVQEVQREVESYKAQLVRKNTKFKIVDESVQQDGSIILKIKKQHNHYDCEGYLD